MHTAQPNRRSSTCVTSQQPALAQHRPSFSSTSNNKFINSALHSLPTGPPSRVLAVPRLSPFAVEPFHPKHRQIKPRDSNNNSKSLAKISSSANMMGVLKVVLPVLGTAQIVLAFLYADPGFQKKVRYLTAVLHVLFLPSKNIGKSKPWGGWLQPRTSLVLYPDIKLTLLLWIETDNVRTVWREPLREKLCVECPWCSSSSGCLLCCELSVQHLFWSLWHRGLILRTWRD